MNSLFKKQKVLQRMFDGIVECVLLEGLTTSYDIKKLQKHLNTKFNDIKIQIPSGEEFEGSNFNYHAYSFLLKTKHDIKQQLKKELNVYGYFIQKEIKTEDYIKYQIEPRYPIQINDILKKKGITYFYHITPTSNLKKIMKIGLAPRGSETDFYHPDDRIYLINLDEVKLKKFVKLLAQHKQLKSEDFTVLQIPYNDKYQYYLDDMATFKHFNMIAVFVLQNIKPNEIKELK